MMKQLVSGPALLAVLALSMPAGAQAPATPSAPGTAAPSQVAPSSSAPAGQPMQAAPGMHQHPADQGMPRRHKMGGMRGHGPRQAQGQMHHRMHRGGMARKGSQTSDNVADQLNAQEAQRLSGGTMPMQGSMPMQGGMMQGGMPMHGNMPMQAAPAGQPQPGSAPSPAPMR